MEATVVDLRYRMKEVLKALERNEEVSILYHGKIKGTIRSVQNHNHMRVRDHAFFDMDVGERSVDEEMEELRGMRYRDI